MKLLFYLITDKAVLDSAVSKYTVEHDSAASEFSNFSARNRKHIEEHLMIWRRGPYWVRLKKKKKYRGKNLITLSLTKYLPAIFFLFASAKSCDTENWILAIFLHMCTLGWVDMYNNSRFFNVRQAHLRSKVPKQANFPRSLHKLRAEITCELFSTTLWLVKKLHKIESFFWKKASYVQIL